MLFDQVTTYMKSSVYQNKLQTIKKFKDISTNILKSGKEKTQDYRRAMAIYDRQRAIDESEINNTRQEKDMYLKLAVK